MSHCPEEFRETRDARRETFCDVALPVPLATTFTYAIPPTLADTCVAGMRVEVPFRRGTKFGIVMRTNTTPSPGMKCRAIFAVCDSAPLIAPVRLALCEWISRYYAAPIGEVCRAALPAHFFLPTKKIRTSRLAPAHHGTTTFHSAAHCVLTATQQDVTTTLTTALQAAQFQTFLLHGITGSGKTEIYLELIAASRALGKQALLLLPEIGLTPQLLDRVTQRFGDQIAIYHSGLTNTQRREQWERMQTGTAAICCGTRSALFAPLDNLGCIILDEEHDASYKQEESPRYHGRDVAVMRAKMHNAIALLGSATPSLESFHNVARGKFTLLELPERPGTAVLPSIELIDLRETPTSNDQSGMFSPRLLAAIGETLARQEQTLLFLNKRGFAQMLLCPACGHVFRCPNCDISLTLHRRDAELRCHYCEYTLPRPKICVSCHGDFLKAVGSGTERIEGALAEHFPTARIARLDRDTSMRRDSRESVLRAMRRSEIDILVGTQMITKGHDFPRVTLVGVVLADLALYLPDFRAAERTFQLLTQVAGRAGRADLPGRVLIQTYTPTHYSLVCAQAHDVAGFVKTENAHREELGYPPYGRLINIRLSGNNANAVATHAENLRAKLEHAWRGGTTRVGILGPAPAPIERVAGRHRWQILLKAHDARQLAQVIATLEQCANATSDRSVHVAIDVDPMSLM